MLMGKEKQITSDLIREVRSLGMAVKKNIQGEELVGDRLVG